MRQNGRLKILLALAVSNGAYQKASAQTVDLSPITLPTTVSSASSAGGLQHAFQWWTPVYMDMPLSKDQNNRLYFEANPRLGDSLNGMGQLILRTAIGRRFRYNTSVYAGYAFNKTFQPSSVYENRVYQQFGYNHSLGKKILINHRFRLEERFIQGLNGNCSVRGRYFLRAALPITKNYYLASFDELFVNFNSIQGGPQAGIDQNRYFAGIGRRIGKKVNVECGYQFQYVNRSDQADDRAGHVLLTQMFIML